jgi:hypothetical protein
MIFFRKYVEKVQRCLKYDKKAGNLQEDQYTFSIISRSVLLGMRNISDKICRENQNTHFTFNCFSSPPPSPENRAVYEIMWKNMVDPERPQMAIQYGACAFH